MGIGVSAYATSIFFEAMFTDLGWSRGDLALSMSVGAILAAIASPVVGVVVDKHGAGRIMAIGAFASGVCLILSGYIYELWQAFIIFSLLALFRVGFVAIPGMTMVSHWFLRKRGRAMGILTAGQGMGGFLLSLLTIFLISSLGWRMAWVGIGLLTWIVMIPAALLIAKQKPEVMGLFADGAVPEKRDNALEITDDVRVRQRSDKWAMKDILRMPIFWLIGLLFPLHLFGHLSIFQHSYALFTDRGISAMNAGTMVGILGLFSLCGKLLLGYLSDKISVRLVMMVALAISAASMLLLVYAEPILGAWLFIIIWGLTECGIIALQPVFIANSFDKAIIGKMIGIFMVLTVFPQLIGPPFMGYVFDITGSYNLALFAFIILYLISLVMVFFTRSPKKTAPQLSV